MKRLLRIFVSFLLIGVILWQIGDLREVGRLIRSLDPISIVLLVLIMTADRVLMTYKWALLLRGRGLRLPFFEGLKVYAACVIWGMFLPSTVGADAVRAFSISRKGLDANQVIASILIERMIGFLSAIVMGLISLGLLFHVAELGSKFELVGWMAGALFIVAILLFAASFSQWGFDFMHGRLLRRFRENRILQRLREFHATYLTYQDDKPRLVAFFALTFVEQLTPILNIWLIGRGIGVEVNILSVAGVVPLSLLISRIPVSIDGLGVLDGIFVLLMSAVGVASPQAVAMIVTGRLIQTGSMLPWWVIQVVGRGSVRVPPPVVREARPDYAEKSGRV